MMKAVCETEQEYFLQHVVHQKLHGHIPSPKCKGTILVELAAELKHIRDECCGVPGQFNKLHTHMLSFLSFKNKSPEAAFLLNNIVF